MKVLGWLIGIVLILCMLPILIALLPFIFYGIGAFVLLGLVFSVVVLIVMLIDAALSPEGESSQNNSKPRAVAPYKAAAPPYKAPVVQPKVQSPAAWYVDPWDSSSIRYWDGTKWTGYTGLRIYRKDELRA